MGRKNFDQELQRIQDEVLVLGSMVEEALIKSVEILKQRDLEGARRLIAQDQVVNDKRFAIEADVLALIATQQPVAGDMRILAAMLDIVTELERIGDYAKGIARINLLIEEKPLLKPLIDLPRMATKACDMLHGALEAFVWRDVGLARAIPDEDHEVDRLYKKIDRELLDFIVSDPTPSTIDRANYLLWAAHNLERTGDRVINLCERVVYAVTGELAELDTDDWGLESLH